MNLYAIAICWWFSIESCKDILRASTFIILIVIGTVWVTSDIGVIYTALFDSYMPHTTVSSQHKQYIVCAADILFHIGPVILIGLPQHAASMGIAYLLFLTWLLFFYDKIQYIYAPGIRVWYPFMSVTIIVLCSILF
jgi:hypothetical protein